MEVLFKITVILCLTPVNYGARFVPSINIQSPINFDVGVNNVNSQIKPIAELDQCFCFPSKPHLGTVINTLDASNESIERVVVYLYKVKGDVILFIPNKYKQKPFPDLYFDYSEGDILTTVTSQLIVDIFDSNVFNPLQTVTIAQDIVLEPEPITIVANQLEPIDSGSITYESNVPSDFISVEIEEDISFTDDNISFDHAWPITNENKGIYPQNGGIINIPNADQFIVIPSPEPEAQELSISSITPISLIPSTISPIPSVSPTLSPSPISIPPIPSTLSPIPSISPTLSPTPISIPPIQSTISAIPSISPTLSPIPISIPQVPSTISPVPSVSPTLSPIPISIPQIPSTIPPISINQVPLEIQVLDIPNIEAASPVNIMTPVSLDIQSIDNNDQDSLVFSNLDEINIDLHTTNNNDNLETIDINISNIEDFDGLEQIISITPTVSQSQPQPNVHSADTVTTYITFEKWFELQLKRVVLYNLETESKFVQLRERVKKILLDNGMQLNIHGVITDVNGMIVKMSNIKLRPILIGAPSDPYSYVTSPESGVSYVQLLEVISSAPPKLFGTLVVGTVFLPRNIYGQNANAWNKIQKVDSTQGCTTCGSGNLPLSSTTGLRYPPQTYGNYDGLPFRRSFGKGRPVSSQRNIQYDKHGVVVPEPQSVQADGRSGLGSVFDGLLGNLGVVPPLMFNPTRRLLAGGPKGPKAGPQSYPNDDLPGFRIVGGNAATSSGTPLANKGRSAFERPSHVV